MKKPTIEIQEVKIELAEVNPSKKPGVFVDMARKSYQAFLKPNNQYFNALVKKFNSQEGQRATPETFRNMQSILDEIKQMIKEDPSLGPVRLNRYHNIPLNYESTDLERAVRNIDEARENRD